jgi:hypothetical protein
MKSLMLSQPRTSVWFGAAKAGLSPFSGILPRTACFLRTKIGSNGDWHSPLHHLKIEPPR